MSTLASQTQSQSISYGELQFAMKGAAGNAPKVGGMAVGGEDLGLGGSAAHSIKFSDVPLEFKDSTNTLGANIDNNFKFGGGVDSIIHLKGAFETDLTEAMALIEPASLKKGEDSLTMDSIVDLSSAKSGLSQLTISQTPVQGLFSSGQSQGG